MSAADDAALVLSVHRSNYRIEGFTESVAVADLAGLGLPVVADIGSGLLDAACPWLADGPPAWLQGGPQAGVIAGRADLVAACGAHPLARALRPGSLVLHALQDLALAYLRRDGDAIPFWRMATLGADGLRERAAGIAPGLVADMAAVPGGGTLPGVEVHPDDDAVLADALDRLGAR